MPSETVDGMDVIAVEVAARRAVKSIRNGEGPRYLECRGYRFRAHSMFDAQLYRPREEIDEWKTKGPIVRFREWLEDSHLVYEDELARIEAEVEGEVAAAVDFAERGTPEPVDVLTRFVTMAEVPS